MMTTTTTIHNFLNYKLAIINENIRLLLHYIKVI